jgi:hypothetical protein
MTENRVPEIPIVGSLPVAVDPSTPAAPRQVPGASPVPKPSPEGTAEFWTHVIR